jgi:hypothetical protein
MQEAKMLTRRLREAADPQAVVAAGWEAFDFIATTASAYDDPDVYARGYAYMLPVTACRGRNALGLVPTLPDDDSTAVANKVHAIGDESRATATLAYLADVLRERLAAVLARTHGQDDRRACEAAVAAAAETHALLTA